MHIHGIARFIRNRLMNLLAGKCRQRSGDRKTERAACAQVNGFCNRHRQFQLTFYCWIPVNNRVGERPSPLLACALPCGLVPLHGAAQSSSGMTFSTTRAPGTRQLLLTCFLWVPVHIKNEWNLPLVFYVHIILRSLPYKSPGSFQKVPRPAATSVPCRSCHSTLLRSHPEPHSRIPPG